MNLIQAGFIRMFQGVVRLFQKMIRFPIPKVYESLEVIPSLLKEKNVKKPMLVVSNSVSKSDGFQGLVDALKKEEITPQIYYGVSPDPTFKAIEVLRGFYLAHECDSILAMGGGSVIDAAKAMGALVVYPKKRLSDLRGLLKVKRKLPYFIAIPTTAGTGSEATIASVVTDEEKNDKFAISDGNLIPDVAVLDDSLLMSVPKHIIAQTGMDAYCHALEAFIGRGGTRFTNENAKKALSLISYNLYPFYKDSSNDKARKNMLYASYYAGIAFTRAYVGYVHALAHAVGGQYHKPHGYCIAILLPYVLEAYGRKAYKRLSQAFDAMELGDKNLTMEDKAKSLIQWIRKLNSDMGIPKDFGGLIKEKDFSSLALHASHEANPWYPVPKELNLMELRMVLIRANKRKA